MLIYYQSKVNELETNLTECKKEMVTNRQKMTYETVNNMIITRKQSLSHKK